MASPPPATMDKRVKMSPQEQHVVGVEEPAVMMDVVERDFTVWRKNVPFLYNVMLTSALEWPSLTVEWSPERRHNSTFDDHFVEYDVLLGTQVMETQDEVPHSSSSEANLVKIAKVVLPSDRITVEARKYDADRNELGGYSATKAKVETSIQMVNEGHVDRARYMPQPQRVAKDGSEEGFFIVATRMDHGVIGILDYSKHSSKPRDNICRPQIRGVGGHDDQGYGLSWSFQHKGRLATCASNTVACWDVTGAAASSEMSPMATFTHDQVADVSFARTSREVFASVSLNGSLLLWDARQPNNTAELKCEGDGGGEFNAVGFEPGNDTYVACGGSDSIVYIWDPRNPAEPSHKLKGHGGEIYQLAWHPTRPLTLATCGTDKRVMIWDLKSTSKVIEIDVDKNDDDTPSPELVFMHAGHTDTVSDVSWKGDMVASVAQDNVIHIWEPSCW